MTGTDRSKFLATFRVEAEEHLTKLNQDMVKLEKDKGNVELINELNREAHTLKGAARMMGFAEVSEAAHKIEDVFGAIARKESAFTPEVADQVFKDLDRIHDMLARSLEPAPPPEEKAPSPAAEKSPQAGRSAVADGMLEEYIKVPVSRIDKLVNMVGEMVVSRGNAGYKLARIRRLYQLVNGSQRLVAQCNDRFRGYRNFDADPHLKAFKDTAHQISIDIETIKKEVDSLRRRISSEALRLDPVVEMLQESVRQMRMLPAATLFDTYPRLVRDIASTQKKQVDLEIIGDETEIDKKVLEEINPALIHILRNCVDHGIVKQGRVTLAAWHEGGNVIIEVKDNGVGIDPEKVKAAALKKKLKTEDELEKLSPAEALELIFLPGFSTSEIITEVSGRGVGLDVVKAQAIKLRGQVMVDSAKGRGTVFRLRLPLTVAIIQALLVEVEGETFALPMLSINEIINVKPDMIKSLEGKTALELRGHTLPVLRLAEILELAPQRDEENVLKDAAEVKVVISSSLGKQLGFIVDKVIGKEDVYVKSLGDHLGRVRNVEGVTILGSGEVVVILDVPGLIENAKFVKERGRTAVSRNGKGKKRRILLVEDSLTTRELERNMLEGQGYEVATAVDGLEAINEVSRRKPDLIVADVQMPRMDGFQMCDTLRKNQDHKDIPVVIVSSVDKDEFKRRGIEVGADAYISKSTFNQNSMFDVIRRLLT